MMWNSNHRWRNYFQIRGLENCFAPLLKLQLFYISSNPNPLLGFLLRDIPIKDEEIILSKLGIGDLFLSLAKTLTYSAFYLTPILFRGGYFSSRDNLITKNAWFRRIWFRLFLIFTVPLAYQIVLLTHLTFPLKRHCCISNLCQNNPRN